MHSVRNKKLSSTEMEGRWLLVQTRDIRDLSPSAEIDTYVDQIEEFGSEPYLATIPSAEIVI